MRLHEQRLGEAKASNWPKRADRLDRIEDSLVEDGMEAVEEYIATLDRRWEQARCLAEYDGLRMGYDIARCAKERLAQQVASQRGED
jgi:hypothetical protein